MVEYRIGRMDVDAPHGFVFSHQVNGGRIDAALSFANRIDPECSFPWFVSIRDGQATVIGRRINGPLGLYMHRPAGGLDDTRRAEILRMDTGHLQGLLHPNWAGTAESIFIQKVIAARQSRPIAA